MSRWAIGASILLLTVLFGAPRNAAAQDGDATGASSDALPTAVAPTSVEVARDQEARALFAAGTSALDEGRFEDALGYFEHAYALSHRVGLLYNIGLTSATLQRRDRAIEAFEQFLHEDPGSEHRREVEGRLAVLRAPGSTPAAARPPVAAAAPRTRPRDREDARPGPWIVIASSAAVTAGGAALFVAGLLTSSTVTDAADGTPWVSVASDYDRGVVLTTAGGIAMAVGVAGVAAGIVWRVASGDGAERMRVAAGLGGLALEGDF